LESSLPILPPRVELQVVPTLSLSNENEEIKEEEEEEKVLECFQLPINLSLSLMVERG